MPTTAGGLPYVASSDLVSGYPAVSLALADELDDQLALKAPLASPALTGTPTLNGTALTTGGLVYRGQAVASASLALTFNSVFTSSWDVYLITFSGEFSADDGIYLRMRASGTDNTDAASYKAELLRANDTTITGNRYSDTRFIVGAAGANNYNSFRITLYRPALAVPTGFDAVGNYGTGLATAQLLTGVHTTASAFDGFTLYPGSGTITSGTARVYGYANS